MGDLRRRARNTVALTLLGQHFTGGQDGQVQSVTNLAGMQRVGETLTHGVQVRDFAVDLDHLFAQVRLQPGGGPPPTDRLDHGCAQGRGPAADTVDARLARRSPLAGRILADHLDVLSRRDTAGTPEVPFVRGTGPARVKDLAGLPPAWVTSYAARSA
jgi:hypothetical protein